MKFTATATVTLADGSSGRYRSFPVEADSAPTARCVALIAGTEKLQVPVEKVTVQVYRAQPK